MKQASPSPEQRTHETGCAVRLCPGKPQAAGGATWTGSGARSAPGITVQSQNRSHFLRTCNTGENKTEAHESADGGRERPDVAVVKSLHARSRSR